MSLDEIKGKNVSNWIRYKLIWNSPLVFIVFFGIDIIYYGFVNSSGTYWDNITQKVLWMAVLALFYTHAYHKACYGWWLTNWEKIKVTKNIASNQAFIAAAEDVKAELEKKHFNSNLWSSIYFGFLMGVVFIAIIALSCYVIAVVYMYGLGAIRGEIPENLADDAVLITQTIIAGATLEICGREESGDVRDP